MQLKSAVGFSIGPIVGAFIGLVTLPINAWIFSPDDIGRLNIFQTICSLMLLFSVLGLDQAYVREYHEVANKEALLKACVVPGLILLVTISSIGFFFSGRLSQLLFGLNNSWLYVIAVFSFFVNYLSRFLSLILRMQGRGFAFSMSQVLPKIIQLVMMLGMIVITFEKKFIHLLVISVTSMLFVLIIYAWNTRRQWLLAVFTPIDNKQLKMLFGFGFPLIFAGLAYWGLIATSTFALHSMSTLSELAVYSVATSFAGAAAIFQSIFTVIWAPMVYKWVADGVDLKRIDVVTQQVLAVVCILVVACGSLAWIIDFLLPAHYIKVKYLFLCCIIQPLFYTLSEVTCMGIAITRRTYWSVLVTMVALVTNITLSAILVPQMGASGAAIANAIAFLAFFIVRTEVSARVWRQFPRKKLYFCTILIVAFCVSSVLFGELMPFSFCLIWFCMSPFLYFFFREQIHQIFNMIYLVNRRKIVATHES